ncbi:hypothetical protein LPJ63_000699 [Coemansia sp. RSA 2711]|nr:hypothetical protein LPJ63_000699 [Coemansia sp. RSA 2711]
MEARQAVFEHPAGGLYGHRHSYHPYHRDASPPAAGSLSLSPGPVAIKGKRKRASPQQLEVLNKVFASTSFPSTEMRNRLARELGMTPRTVQIWFQNKRQASRQRDGHHSRNTKSMAAAANVNSFGRQYSKSRSRSSSKSQTPAASSSPAQQLMTLVDAATAARPGPPSPAWADAYSHRYKLAEGADAYSHKLKLGNLTASGQHAEAAHTRNDQWFAEGAPSRLDYLHPAGPAPARLDYLYSAGPAPTRLPSVAEATAGAKPARPLSASYPAPPPQHSAYPQQHSAGARLPPLSPPAPRVLPVQRSMSLMDMLNAPPQQRRLPPLPPVAP